MRAMNTLNRKQKRYRIRQMEKKRKRAKRKFKVLETENYILYHRKNLITHIEGVSEVELKHKKCDDVWSWDIALCNRLPKTLSCMCPDTHTPPMHVMHKVIMCLYESKRKQGLM